MIDYCRKVEIESKFCNVQRISEVNRRKHVSDVQRSTPTTLYKNTFSHPQQKGVYIHKKPQYPANSNFLKFDHNLKSHYETINDKLWNKDQVRAKAKVTQSLDLSGNQNKFLLSSEHTHSKYDSNKKPMLTKVNVLGNMNNLNIEIKLDNK